ncbi:MAG: DoxX family protein [Bacteroidia bacterium]|nr:DoxX family protein [Bacteroidia bacterium]
MKVIVQISRVLVGVLFILSGFIKANDTIGFSYKLVEYFEVFHMPIFVPYAVAMAMLICIVEICVGIALLIGAYARANAWLLLIMIVFFTLLTGYSAITHKVTDCGCFGDAVKLKPVQSFIKDLVLLVFILIIFYGHQYIKPLFNQGLQTIALGISLLVTTAFTLYTYMFLPKIDFLPYKVGNNIQALMKYPEGALRDSFEMVFLYQKGGELVEVSMDKLATLDSTYTFVDRKDKLVREGYKLPIFDFKLYDSGGIEYTDSLLADTLNYKLIVVQLSLLESRNGTGQQLQALTTPFVQAGYDVWGLTASSLTDAEAYRHEHQLMYPYYLMDPTPLKSIVRSNPGIVLMKGNTVIKKWSSYAIPSFETLQKYLKQ